MRPLCPFVPLSLQVILGRNTGAVLHVDGHKQASHQLPSHDLIITSSYRISLSSSKVGVACQYIVGVDRRAPLCCQSESGAAVSLNPTTPTILLRCRITDHTTAECACELRGGENEALPVDLCGDVLCSDRTRISHPVLQL